MTIYKDCDIRGVYGEDLNNQEAELIGRAIGTILNGAGVVVAGDARISGYALKTSLIKGLISCGCAVSELGTIPTPALYFAHKYLKVKAAVMVTASHNPAEYNGFKLILGEKPVSPKDIQRIKSLVESQDFVYQAGSLDKRDIRDKYAKFLLSQLNSKKQMRIVVDCGNGAASEIAPTILRKAGHEVIEIFCSFDGSFPNRSPNPSNARNLSALQAKVIAENADIGVAFDGDGDRAVFVDEKGRFCEAEKSFVILLEHYLAKEPSAVVYDAKSSSIIKKTIEKYGSRAVMERSGHAFIKTTFLKTNAVLAGEVSGHYFFRELGFDDGIYAALKMVEIVAKSEKTMSALIDEIENTVITPDIRIAMSSKRADSILENLKSYGSRYRMSLLDGVRIELPNGWLLARKSVTEPCITIRLEADNLDEAERISRNVFYDNNPDIYKAIIESL